MQARMKWMKKVRDRCRLSANTEDFCLLRVPPGTQWQNDAGGQSNL